jgi:hypothetical protein
MTMFEVRRNSVAKILAACRGIVLCWLQLFGILRGTQRMRSEVAICVRGRLRKGDPGMFDSVEVGSCICLIRTRDAHEVGARGAGVSWGECHVI